MGGVPLRFTRQPDKFQQMAIQFRAPENSLKTPWQRDGDKPDGVERSNFDAAVAGSKVERRPRAENVAQNSLVSLRLPPEGRRSTRNPATAG